eukprot:Gb_20668 [translate_table: standard]
MNSDSSKTRGLVITMHTSKYIGLPAHCDSHSGREYDNIRNRIVVAHEINRHAAEFLLIVRTTGGNVLPQEGIPYVSLVPAFNDNTMCNEMRDITVVNICSDGIDHKDPSANEIGI